MPSPDSGKQWPALSPTQKTPSSTARRRRWGNQLPWKRTASASSRPASRTGGSLTWWRGSEAAAPRPGAAPGGTRPPVAAAHERALAPDVERVPLPARVRMDLQAPRQRRVGRLVVRRGQRAPPPQRVAHERRAERAAVGAHGQVAPVGAGAALDRRGGELRLAALLPQSLAE